MMGLALRQSIELLVEQGYPPEAVVMELYMSGELGYTYQRAADTGLLAQMDFHSHTSQYGSMTRSARLRHRSEAAPPARSTTSAPGLRRRVDAEQQNGLQLFNQMKEMPASIRFSTGAADAEGFGYD